MPSAWEHLADVLIQRAALVTRVDRNRSPDPLAGLKVDDEDLVNLLAELPGLEVGDDDGADEIEQALSDAVVEASDAFDDSLDADEPFARIVASARLVGEEARILGLLCAVELDPRRQRLVGYLNDDVTQRRLTPWTLRQITGTDDSVRVVGPGGGLRRAALLTPMSDGAWASAPIGVVGTVLWWLQGDRFFDPELPPGVEMVAGPSPDGSGPGGGAAEIGWVEAGPIVVAAGPDRVRRLQAAIRAIGPGGGGRRSGNDHVLVTRGPASPSEWDAVVRQATLAACSVVVEVDDKLDPAGRDRIERATHLSWAIVSAIDLPLSALPRRPWAGVEVETPGASAAEWAATFPQTPDPTHRLTAEQLIQVGRAAEALQGDIAAGVRRLAAGHIDATATRIRPSRSWDDLVLAPERLDQVADIARRWRQRDTVFGTWGFSPQPSTGVIALFAGASGTGKTLAAEIIATELGVDLYKIDLANLISKYIGETEQNLSRVFDAAEASSVVLFFDEADALLGRRSEVSDAHDRYANIEVAYLLQRLERFEGVAVMATNLLKNIDPAFLRRLHLVIEFPMPEAAERRRIWRHSIPPGAPVAADLDVDRLADNFELSGGTIHNAVMSAAFLAADAGTPITMDLAVIALRRELVKIGRLVSEADFA